MANLAIAATTILPNCAIMSEEGESDRIAAIAPLPIMKMNAHTALPADHNVTVLATLGNIAVKASVTAT